MSDNTSIEIIRFGSSNPSLEDYQSIFWNPGTTKYVEFYKNKQVPVTVVDIDNPTQLNKSLSSLVDDHPMSIDFEWKPDTSNSNNPISLFQIGSSKGVLIVLNSQNVISHGKDFRSIDFFNACPEGLTIMKEFLNSNLFYGKGMSCDRKKLKQLFNQTFQMEDIDTTRLQPHELTSNFSELVTQLIGDPDAKFKDQNISKSNWNNRPLTIKQILYAAFDAYATRLFLNYFVNKYGEEEFIDPSTISIDKTTKKNKKQKAKNQQHTTNDDDDPKKNKNNDNSNINKQNQKEYKPKFDVKVKFDDVDNYLYLLDDDEITDLGYGFEDIKRDSDKFVETGIYPTGYNPKNSLKRRILCLQEIVQLPEEKENPSYFCKLCNTKIDASSLDSHIWMKHFEELPFVYFPDQSPSYIEKCLQTIFIACSNFQFFEEEKNKEKETDKKDQKNKTENDTNESTKDEDKTYRKDDKNEDDEKDQKNKKEEDDKNEETKNEDDEKDQKNKTENDTNESKKDEDKTYKKDDKNEDDEKDQKNDDKNDNINNDFYLLEKEVVCTLCDHNFPSFGTFFAHVQHMHSKTPRGEFHMTVKDVLFNYLTKVRLFETDTHFCRLCNRKVDHDAEGDTDSDHCWRFHGEEIVKMLKHRPNRYSTSCFTSCFPFGVTCIHPMNSGQIFKGSISCSFCKIGFDDPGELFVHLFHRHTKAIAVRKNDTYKWPIRAFELHKEFLEIMEKWCFQSAVKVLSDESIGVIEEIDEDEDENEKGKEIEESKKMKKTKKKKKNKFFNKILYRCNECKDVDDNFEEFHSPKQLWNHIVNNHLIITFDFM